MTTFADLLIQKTKAVIYSEGLAIAQALGLPVTSWQPGDPTRALFNWQSESLALLSGIVNDFFRSAFLDYAAESETLYQWLCVVAEQNFGYIPRSPTYAQCTVRLTNTGGGLYAFDVGDVTVKNSVSGATYHNVASGTLTGLSYLDLLFEADLAGSESNSDIEDVDTMVTNYLLVTCSNTTAAVAIDAESATSIVQGCRAKLGRMTNGGPKDAYVSVALDSSLTGITTPARARVTTNSSIGNVAVYVAGVNDVISAPDIVKVQDAVDLWAVPLCVTAGVFAATKKTIGIVYHAYAYKSWGVTNAEAKTAIAATLNDWSMATPIGGDIVSPDTVGRVRPAMAIGAIKAASPKIVSVELTGGDLNDLIRIESTEFMVLDIESSCEVTMIDDP